MKKKVYIISHSHWDREWYMAYEQHHMRLVELMDDLLELFEKDPEFNSFHLDGQTIILDDYLQVRPEKRELVQQAITAGKLRIGPFYICLLYTSDAADEEDSGDLGGCRII